MPKVGSAAVLTELKGLGVTLALDDFGTDYSSLGYLTQLPFDKLKIDRIFIDGIADSERARKLLEGIIALGRGLNMTIVAEGAEKLDEVEILRGFNCDIVQGFIFARAIHRRRSPRLCAQARRQSGGRAPGIQPRRGNRTAALGGSLT